MGQKTVKTTNLPDVLTLTPKVRVSIIKMFSNELTFFNLGLLIYSSETPVIFFNQAKYKTFILTYMFKTRSQVIIACIQS